MLRKVALTAVGLAALACVLSFTKAGSYMRTGWHHVSVNTASQVPVEFEIERLKQEVAQLIPDLKKQLNAVAEEMAAVDKLEREIATAKANLEKEKVKLVQMAKDLETGETQFVYNGKIYPREQVAVKMGRDWESYKRAQADIKAREQLLTARKQALDTAKEQLAAIKEQEASLKVEIAELEAQLKTVRLQETRSQFSVDDTRLGEIKRSLEDVRVRLQARRNALELQAQFTNDFKASSADTPAPRPVKELAREIRESLEGTKSVEQ